MRGKRDNSPSIRSPNRGFPALLSALRAFVVYEYSAMLCAGLLTPHRRLDRRSPSAPGAPANARRIHSLHSVIGNRCHPSNHKLSQNHSHSRGSTNIGAHNACAHAVSKFSTIHRHTTCANRSPHDQIPIIENTRESCCFWHSVARATSKTRPRRSVSPIEDPPWRNSRASCSQFPHSSHQPPPLTHVE